MLPPWFNWTRRGGVILKISGQVIVVTGASRGIGKATAELLARKGARVALLARSPEVEVVAAEIVAAGGEARGYPVDLSDAAAVERMAARVVADLGRPDIVVNNAGAGRFLFVEETAPEEAAAMIATPYLAAFYVTRAFLPAMLERRGGQVVMVNSPAPWLPWPGATGYTAARGAVRAFTAALRTDLRGTGVRVIEIVAGKVATTYFDHNPGSEERIPRITRLVPTSTPEQVAAAIVRGIERDQPRVVTPAMLGLVLLGHALAPGLVDWLMWRTGWRRRTGQDQNEASASFEGLLMRLSALGCILGGLFIAAFVLIHPWGQFVGAAIARTAAWRMAHSFHFIGAVFALAGLIGIFVHLRGKLGALGVVGFIVSFIGNAMFLGTGMITAFIWPMLAEHAPATVEMGGPIFGVPTSALAFVLTAATIAVGYVLFGLAILRTSAFPAAAVVALVAGAILGNIPPYPFSPMPWAGLVLGGVLYGGALAWLGGILWRSAAATA
jgi:NADP-dependent 3-hydroxy acid dehydrogenase YdfG